MFAKPECDNVLQPKPEAVKAAAHDYTRAWPNLKTQENNVISSLLYTYNRLNCFDLAFSRKRIKLKFICEL